MKFASIIVFSLGIFVSTVFQAFAQEGWVINSFQSDIDIQREGTVRVEEVIQVDFFDLEKHGIYRDIPYVYSNNNNKTYTTINVESVFQDGEEAEYKVTTTGEYIRIRIGDPDRTIQGTHTYTISYLVTGVVLAYQGYDELYWNVTGNNWEASIEKASARISIPANKILDTECFVGPLGANAECSTQTFFEREAVFTAEDIAPMEGFSIVTSFPPGTVPILTVPAPKTLLEEISSPFVILAFVLPTILGIGLLLRYWWKNGRDRMWNTKILFDPHAKETIKPLGHDETIVVEYTPPEKLRPAELGVIADEKADTRDITATIIDLAARGYLEIEEIEKKWVFGSRDYKFTRTKMAEKGLLPYESLLLEKLFEKGESDKTVLASTLKKNFYTSLKKVKSQLYKDVVSKKYFPTNPETIRSGAVGIGIGLLIVGVAGLIFFAASNLFVFSGLAAGLVLPGLLTLLLSPSMPRRTPLGNEMRRRIEGYELFLTNVETHKQRFLENKNIINDILPYTIVFGLTEKFTKALNDMGIKPENPTWYHSTRPFNAAVFGQSLTTFSDSISRSIASAPRSSGFSSGGGYSGGGFGGGGGGSW